MADAFQMPPFESWAARLQGPVVKLAGRSFELLDEQRAGFHVYGLSELAGDTPAPEPSLTFEGLGKVPFLYPESVLAPFINPVFWGNFCSIKTSGAQIYGGESPYGWRGYVDEHFTLGVEPCELEIQNELDIKFVYPTGTDAYARADYSLRKALAGGMILNEGYMRTLPLAFSLSWLEGKKTFGFDPTSQIGKVLAGLPRPAVELLLTVYLTVNLLSYSFNAAQRVWGSGMGVSSATLRDYYAALSDLGFDPISGRLVRLPAF